MRIVTILLFFSFGNIWFILMNEMLVKLCGNMFSRTFGMVGGKKLLSSATAAIPTAVATGGLVAGVHYSNKLHATTPGADFQSTGFSFFLGDAHYYQKKAGLKTYDTNFGRDISHAFKNSTNPAQFDTHILDENGTSTTVSKKAINGPLTQQQFNKAGIKRVQVPGTTVFELKFTNDK
jgi:hypothetical protein